MKTPEEMRDEAQRCIRLARQTIDNSVASALLAYAGELEQRAQLLEKSSPDNRTEGCPARQARVPADHATAGR
ncbi:MAG TPA: hypothetical protein VN823_00590 [Stellaceae bacterium]|nr:hypothetical protein [Stellaceae bacterium]